MAALVVALWAAAPGAQPVEPPARGAPAPDAAVEAGPDSLVQLDFSDAELNVVIDTIARLTGKNFIYDDRVRGRVTIVSPTRMTVDQAYAVFESMLQVKGFTTVPAPGGAIKVIPIREAKESSIDTSSAEAPNRDRYVTRLVPLRFIDADAIAATLKPLVSGDAALVAYAPTNTLIVTDSASNIRRLLSILESIDVETYREELAVIQVKHADADSLAEQLGVIYGAEAAAATPSPRARRAAAQAAQAAAQAGAGPSRPPPRILTDPRTNSLIILASRGRLEEIRRFVARLDVPISGEGGIYVYYLKHADAEEMASTLGSLTSGGGARAPRAQQAERGGDARDGGERGAIQRASTATSSIGAQVLELAGGVTISADVGTNSLVIQGSKEAYQTLTPVIEKLDIPRPQVLVEALIMEVGVGENEQLGFNGLALIAQGKTVYTIGSLTDTSARPSVFGNQAMPAPEPDPTDDTDDDDDTTDDDGADADLTVGDLTDTVLTNLVGAVTRNDLALDAAGKLTGSFIQGVIRASENVADANIISAPHILTSDNEEAEIKIGSNIPIVTSRVQSAAGQDTGLATSQNIERQDIGVTLRVTPQITEGDTLRMEIFQEITAIDPAASAVTGDPQEVGVSLSSRKVENVVVVADGETVVIGGLLGDEFRDTENKVPWLGDIPILGWLFKSTQKELRKTNLLVFLTPHVVRRKEHLETLSIAKREEFRRRSQLRTEPDTALDAQGLPVEPPPTQDPARTRLSEVESRYPLERMREIEQGLDAETAAKQAAAEAAARAPRYRIVAGVFGDEQSATETLTELVDAGYEGRLVSTPSAGGVVFAVNLGPYPSLEEAQRVAGVIERAFRLAPSLVVEPQGTIGSEIVPEPEPSAP
jgi:general secretion pathway protein D